MALRDALKISRKTFLNPVEWVGYNELRAQNLAIWSILKEIFSKPTPQVTETFEEALQRLQMTQKDCQHAVVQYRILAFLFLMLAMGAVSYTCYLLLHAHLVLGWLLGMAATLLSLTQAFKYDFWAFQLSRRKLGLTFRDWKTSRFGGKGASS